MSDVPPDDAEELRKRLAEAHAARDYLASIMASLAEGVMVQAVTGDTLLANDAAARMCGYPDAVALMASPLAELRGRFELLDEAGAPFSWERLPAARALAGEETPARQGVRFRIKATGEERWSVVSANVVRDALGQPLYAVNVFSDITELKRREKDQRFLSQAGHLLATSLDVVKTLEHVAKLAVPELADWVQVYLLNADLTVRHAVVRHEDPEEERWAQDYENRHPPKPATDPVLWPAMRANQPVLAPVVTEAMLEAAAVSEEHRESQRRSGTRSFLAVPMFSRSRMLGAIFFSARRPNRFDDASLQLAKDLAVRATVALENARLHEDTRASVQDRELTLALLSHDLKGPLGSLSLAVEHLSRSFESGERPPVELQRSVQVSVSQMNRLVDDLLDYNRARMGTLTLRKKTQPLSLLVGSAEELMTPIARARGVRLELLPVEPRDVHLDRELLLRVLGNLLDNAIRFTPSGGAVTLSASADDGKLVLKVDDEGPGIAPEDLPLVFQPYWQGRTIPGELGLGLAISSAIVTAHGGTIRAEASPSKGASFIVTLPLSAAPR